MNLDEVIRWFSFSFSFSFLMNHVQDTESGEWREVKFLVCVLSSNIFETRSRIEKPVPLSYICIKPVRDINQKSPHRSYLICHPSTDSIPPSSIIHQV